MECTRLPRHVRTFSLADRLNGSRNNLDFIRFIAALGVLVSHAFPLGEGAGAVEPLHAWTKGQMTLGGLCVAVFLMASGLLITRSFERSPHLLRFLWARFLRIFPGLAVALLLTVLVLGPALTQSPLREYFLDPRTPLYFFKNLTLFPVYELPGLFLSNPNPQAVNGSLWTLLFEVAFYFVVAGMGVCKMLTRRWVALAWLGAVAVSLVMDRFDMWMELFLYFGAGMLMYLCRDQLKLSFLGALVALVPLIVFARWGKGFDTAVAVAGAYVFAVLAFAPSPFENFAHKRDLSYGIYIYAYPVQQMVAAVGGRPMSWWLHALIAAPLVLLCAAFSWRWVEAPALRLKSWRQKPVQSGTPVQHPAVHGEPLKIDRIF